MRILVLGGTGAMGVDLVKILARRGEDVAVTSRSERNSEFDNVRYVQGDAHDAAFLSSILEERFDVVVDFMVYSTDEFASRRDMLLDAAGQYLYLSSSRVYADSVEPITEDSPRLLDATNDEEYLKTDEYALTKARQENLLRDSGKTNWTIIRPYITYSNQRLQLGVYEKELWLFRALHAQTIVVPRDILAHTTTLTWGEDMARGIAALAGNPKAYGQAVHITTEESIRWSEVLELYQRVFRDVTGYPIKVKYIDSSGQQIKIMSRYQIKYDRLFDRRFDNTKRKQIIGDWEFVSPKTGLEQCMREFLNKPRFRHIPVKPQAWMDWEMGERTPLMQFDGYKDEMKYLVGRYTPYFKMIMKGK